MAKRPTRRLSARSVATIGKPGRHADGDGLYLIVDLSGAKRWLFMFRQAGKLREMGLGSVSAVSLAEAREKAGAALKIVRGGGDPIGQRRAAREAGAAATTFWLFAEKLIDDIEGGFRNEKHRAQWRSTLKTYAAPIHDKRLDEITTDDVLDCLTPIWTTKSETASRVRGRIERVLDAAKAKGLRTGENVARWRGHLDHLLSKRPKLSRGHHAAMPFAKVPAFMLDLRERRAVAALGLEFTILTAARVGEVIGATWGEIDRRTKVWVVPAARMKAGREHRVPLSDRVLAILDEAEKARTGDYVFPGQRRGRPMSNMAFEALLKRMKVEGITIHGFRSSFRDWVGETTTFPERLAEAALAHVVGDETERAYRRGDALEKRRKLMDAWAAYCGNAGMKTKGGVVLELRRPA